MKFNDNSVKFDISSLWLNTWITRGRIKPQGGKKITDCSRQISNIEKVCVHQIVFSNQFKLHLGFISFNELHPDLREADGKNVYKNLQTSVLLLSVKYPKPSDIPIFSLLSTDPIRKNTGWNIMNVWTQKCHGATNSNSCWKNKNVCTTFNGNPSDSYRHFSSKVLQVFF